MVLTYRTTYGLDLDTFYDIDLSYDIMDMTANLYYFDLSYVVWI